MDTILIPWRGGDPARERNLKFVVDWYRPLGLPITLGDSTSGIAFNRGQARNNAAAGAGDWDVALLADADTVAELDVVRTALHMARETGQLIIPHDDFYRLNRYGTIDLIGKRDFYQGHPSQVWKLCAWPRVEQSMMPSGALVISRSAFEAMGRYDEGFIGWGYEDAAFLQDAQRTIGVTRLPGKLFHLWHPRDYGTLAGRRENEARLGSRRAQGTGVE